MVQFLYFLAKAVRVRQWIKNLVIFAAIFFTGKFFDPPFFLVTFYAFAIFCLLSGGIYLLNDSVDAPKDRLHPFKRFRPIASGAISVPFALTMSVLLLFSGLSLSFLFLPKAFFFVTVVFVVLQLSYTFFLKHVTLLDVLAIAGAFILRVFAGEAVTGYHMSIWLFLTIVCVALFLALGKRRSELTLLSGENGTLPKTRVTLSHYSEKMLDVYLSMFSTATWLTYTLYTFLAPTPTLRRTIGEFFEDNFFTVGSGRKWLMITVPFVIYGVMRYLQLIYEKHEGESPEKVFLTDKPLLIAVGLWGVLLTGIIYLAGH